MIGGNSICSHSSWSNGHASDCVDAALVEQVDVKDTPTANAVVQCDFVGDVALKAGLDSLVDNIPVSDLCGSGRN